MTPSRYAAAVRLVVPSGSMQQVSRVRVRYEAARVNEDWVLSEEPVPESSPHDILSDTLKYLLLAWAVRVARRVKIGRNLAMHWDEANPKLGVAPDVYVVEPPPPEGDQISALKLWKEGHHPPLLAIEVVSASNAMKKPGPTFTLFRCRVDLSFGTNRSGERDFVRRFCARSILQPKIALQLHRRRISGMATGIVDHGSSNVTVNSRR